MHSGSRFLFCVCNRRHLTSRYELSSVFLTLRSSANYQSFLSFEGLLFAIRSSLIFLFPSSSFVSRRFHLDTYSSFDSFSSYSLPSLYISLLSLSFSSFLFQFLFFVFLVSIFLRLVCRCSLY